MLNFSIPELAMILVIALIVFGPGKLPEVGKSLGKGLGELRRAVNSEPTENEATTIQAATVEKKSVETK
jgi:twin arginine-targeting protein translocase, TatA/E family